jgi:hypothetical protein
MKKSIVSVILFSAAAFFFVSCSKSSSPTSSNNNNTNGGAGTNQVVATVNGTAITFKTLGTGGNGSYGNGVVSFGIAGLDSASGKTIGIAGGGFVTTGTYDIGTPATASQLYGFTMSCSIKDANGNTMQYGVNSSNQTKVGTITISTISSTNAQGTFSATLPLENGPTGSPATVSITNGGFNVNF